MKVSKILLKKISPEGSTRPGDGRNSKAKRRELRLQRDVARKVQRKRLNAIIDSEISDCC